MSCQYQESEKDYYKRIQNDLGLREKDLLDDPYSTHQAKFDEWMKEKELSKQLRENFQNANDSNADGVKAEYTTKKANVKITQLSNSNEKNNSKKDSALKSSSNKNDYKPGLEEKKTVKNDLMSRIVKKTENDEIPDFRPILKDSLRTMKSVYESNLTWLANNINQYLALTINSPDIPLSRQYLRGLYPTLMGNLVSGSPELAINIIKAFDAPLAKGITLKIASVSGKNLFYKGLSKILIAAGVGASIGSAVPIIGNTVGFVIGAIIETIIETYIALFYTKSGEERIKVAINMANFSEAMNNQFRLIKVPYIKMIDKLIDRVNDDNELSEKIVENITTNKIDDETKKNLLVKIVDNPEKYDDVYIESILKREKIKIGVKVIEGIHQELKNIDQIMLNNLSDKSLTEEMLKKWALEHANDYKSFALGENDDESTWKLLMTNEKEYDFLKKDDPRKKTEISRPLFGKKITDFSNQNELFLHQTNRLLRNMGILNFHINNPTLENSINAEFGQDKTAKELYEEYDNVSSLGPLKNFIRSRDSKGVSLLYFISNNYKEGKDKIDRKKFIKFLKEKFEIDVDNYYHITSKDWVLETIGFQPDLYINKYYNTVYIRSWFLGFLSFRSYTNEKKLISFIGKNKEISPNQLI